MTTPNDLSRLLDEDTKSEPRNHTWLVSFTAKLPSDLLPAEEGTCPNCGEEHDPEEMRIVNDEGTILGTLDGQVIIDRVRARVLDPENIPVLTDFCLTGLKHLAMAEVY